MKNNSKFLAIIVLAAGFTILYSCSKDKRLENRLTKKDGTWNVEKVIYTNVRQDTSGQSITVNATESNAGTWTFNDNDIDYDYTVNGEKRTGTFPYTISEGDITITSYSFSFYGGTSQSAIAYSGTETTKGKKLEISGSESYQGVTGESFTQEVFTATFYLSK